MPVRPRCLARGAVRVFYLTALVVGWSADAAGQSRSEPPDTSWRSLIRQVPRRFRHERHDALPCMGCHGSGATHRLTLIRSPRDCASCHHDPARAQSCEYCHSRDSIPASRTVPLRMSLEVAKTLRVRNVTFRHDVHIASGTGIVCRDCHATAVTLDPSRECGSCHASHHAGRAQCSSCHTPPPPPRAHDANVHLGCAGVGCHAADKAPEPARSRFVCLFCHVEQRQHEPNGDCATCHRIPRSEAPPQAHRLSWGRRP
jgi:hypothetical protein